MIIEFQSKKNYFFMTFKDQILLETYSYLHLPAELATFGHPGDFRKTATGPGC